MYFLTRQAIPPKTLTLPMCIMVYKTLEELYDSVDQQDQPLYQNLEGLTGELEEIWGTTASQGQHVSATRD